MSYEHVLERLHAAAYRSGRRPEEITLLVVSKNQPPSAILAIYAKGQRLFGENRVQELLAKKPALPADIQWHFVGHLQTNKVKALLPHITLLHSLDRESLVAELVRRAAAPVPCLLEVKIAQEPTKHGIPPADVERWVEHLLSLPQIRLRGLMGMASLTTDERQVRREFRTLRQLFERLRSRYPELAWDILSMGMSADFEWAIEEGSTLIRVGSAIFTP
ncbi:MAG: YggS family pyridoxal phosphate-dependent enzyme [Bacteroidia bacterium]|nr:YggS family pyridoxal phosphate-dependent enzyme [Bacteroidia bacterium]MDW8089781.1 YggS family pyridoxal phosphate-dependent enzyme [Bacteroidia bacterium]